MREDPDDAADTPAEPTGEHAEVDGQVGAAQLVDAAEQGDGFFGGGALVGGHGSTLPEH